MNKINALVSSKVSIPQTSFFQLIFLPLNVNGYQVKAVKSQKSPGEYGRCLIVTVACSVKK